MTAMKSHDLSRLASTKENHTLFFAKGAFALCVSASPHATNWLTGVKIGSIYLLLQKNRVVVLMLYFHVCFIFFPLRRQTPKWKLTQTMRKTPVADSSPVFQRIGYYARPKRTQVGFTTSIPWPGRAAGNIPWYLTWIPRWEFVIIQQAI